MKDTVVNVRLSDDLLARIDAIRAELESVGITGRGTAVRMCLELGIDNAMRKAKLLSAKDDVRP
jgi:hypothetical protein